MMTPADVYMREAIDRKEWNRCLAILLAAGYAYYIKDAAIMPDTLFDEACKALLENWKAVDHQHKYLVKPGDLRAGTLFRLKANDYPTVVRLVASDYIHGMNQWKTSSPTL